MASGYHQGDVAVQQTQAYQGKMNGATERLNAFSDTETMAKMMMQLTERLERFETLFTGPRPQKATTGMTPIDNPDGDYAVGMLRRNMTVMHDCVQRCFSAMSHIEAELPKL